MLAISLSRGLAAIALTAVLCWSSSAHAVMFNLVYDDFDDGVLDVGAIVGTGTVSYDGPVVLGAHAIDSLTNFSFSADIGGYAFDEADVLVDGSLSGIVVFDLGGGEVGMVFSGAGGGSSFGGSFDASNGLIGPDLVELSHEPSLGGIGDPVGCCGGDGDVNRYLLDGLQVFLMGDYNARLANPVPEPGSLLLLCLGLAGTIRGRRRLRCPA